jgi:sugar phosphate isomerase/epimerase
VRTGSDKAESHEIREETAISTENLHSNTKGAIMKISQVAAQLFTIRDYLKTPADIAASMKKIRGIGYEAVQVSGMGPIDEKELVTILDGEGLRCCATHEKSASIIDTPENVVQRLQKLGCIYTAYPHPHVDTGTEESVRQLASGLNRAGKILHEAGLVLTYHNHNNEFRKVNSRLVLDILYDETDPRYLQGELDTFWVQAGGGNPAAWCRKMNNRLPLLHIKDFGVSNDNKPRFEEIGRGNLDWPQIIESAESAGCQWFIVEQDGDWLDNDPFASLKTSLDYIKERLIGC